MSASWAEKNRRCSKSFVAGALAVQRPPYPAQAGLDQTPTVEDNIETLAQFVAIMYGGATSYRQTGTQDTPGTKLLTIYAPDLPAGVVVAAPFGASIAQILRQAGVTLTDKLRVASPLADPKAARCLYHN